MAGSVCWIILTLCIPALLASQSCPANFCEEQVKFWLATTKNQAGEWMAEAGMEHPKEAGSRGWKLLVNKESASCEGEKYCRIVATLTGKCPEDLNDGYITTPYGRYILHLDKKTFAEAKASCESEGGHLLVINSKEELDTIKNYFKAIGYITYGFIGITDQVTEGKWLDIFGKPIVPFWSKGEPNNVGIENCAVISHLAEYIDIACERKEDYLCEKSL